MEPGPLWAPVSFTIELCVTDDTIRDNLRATLDRGYKPFTPWLFSQSGTVSVVGSGPSLKETYPDLRGDVMACNGALGFLLDRGIVPRFAFFMDADERMKKFVRRHPDVTYLVASRCHPTVFQALEGLDVVVWHAKSEELCDAILAEHGVIEPLVHGGSAAVTRAMCVAHSMGYREQHLFGADSSCVDGETHVQKSLAEEKYLPILAGGRVFTTTAWMAAQVEDFKVLAPALEAEGAKFEVHGDGLLPHVAKIMKAVRHSNSLEVTNELACV